MTKKAFDYSSDYRTVDVREHPELYRVGKGEQGVLLVQPYKSEILPHWRFKTPDIARESSEKIYQLFLDYKANGDFIGLPGTGKDTYIARHLADWPVISLDNFRRMHRIDPTDREGTGYVVQLAKEEAKAKLRSRTPFVWNATNLTRQIRHQQIDLFASYRARVRLIYLEVPYARLLQQNRNREYVVPSDALERMVHKLEVPAIWEAHEVIYEVD